MLCIKKRITYNIPRPEMISQHAQNFPISKANIIINK